MTLYWNSFKINLLLGLRQAMLTHCRTQNTVRCKDAPMSLYPPALQSFALRFPADRVLPSFEVSQHFYL